MRNILSVVAGYVAWIAVFFPGSAVMRSTMASVHDEAGFTQDATALVLYLVISVMAALAAGFVTAKLATPPAARWVLYTALALLATGVPVQISAWGQLPVWYNLAFLVLIVPATLVGGRLAGAGRTTAFAP